MDTSELHTNKLTIGQKLEVYQCDWSQNSHTLLSGMDAVCSTSAWEYSITTTATKHKTKFHIPFLEGVLPIKESQVPAEIIAGLTLAALAIPEVMGYTKIAGMPVITGPRAIASVGSCTDNAACGGFFGLLKRDSIYRKKSATRREA